MTKLLTAELTLQTLDEAGNGCVVIGTGRHTGAALRLLAGIFEVFKYFAPALLDAQLSVQTLEEAGNGRVLIVDGQGSKRCALLGDLLGAKMHRNGWVVSLSASCLCTAFHA